MISKSNLKYLKIIRRRFRFGNNISNINRYKNKLEFVLNYYIEKDLLFFEIKIYFENTDKNIDKIQKLNKYIEEITEKIKLLEFIHVSKEVEIKNNLYAKLLIGVKSIIGYDKLLLNRYKYIFKNNKNIEIKYLPNNIKIKKRINKIMKIKNLKNQEFMVKNNVFVYDIYERESLIPIKDYRDLYSNILEPMNFSSFSTKFLGLKLDDQFNNQHIYSNRKISVFSLINIWKTYCIINDITYSNNKLYKKLISNNENKIEPIKIKINNELILIDNNENLLDLNILNKKSYKIKYIYIGELDYFVKKINYIMKFMLKCYPQQMNKVLLNKIKKLYLNKAFRILKQMPRVYFMEVYES